MKKVSIIAFISVLALVASNVFSYYNTFRWHKATHESMLKKSIQVSSDLLEQEISQVIHFTEMNLAKASPDGSGFEPLIVNSDLLQTRYIGEIRILGNGFMMVLRKNKEGQFVKSTIVAQEGSWAPGWHFDDARGEIILVKQLTVKTDDSVTICMVMERAVLFGQFLQVCDMSEPYYPWVMNDSGKMVMSWTVSEEMSLAHMGDFKESPGNKTRTLTHFLEVDKAPMKVLSVFYPLFESDQHLSLVFSYPLENLTRSALNNSLAYGAISLIIILIILFYFRNSVRNSTLEKERVRQSEMALTKVLHYLPTGIVLMDKNQRVRQVNRAAVKLFHLEDEDIVLGQMLNEELLFSKFRIKEKSLVSAHGIRYIVIDATNQERVIFNDKIPFFLQSEKYFMESYHELTSYLQPTEKSLHGFKSGFITNISHELRTPLNGIMGIVEMLVKSQNMPEREKEMAILAKRSAETLMGIINDILDYSRLEGGKLEVESIPFNLKVEVDSLIKEFLPEAREKKIVITTDFMAPLPVDFIGDPVRLRQVISNLLNNAIKFTPFGTVQIISRTAKTVNGGPAILISIKDSGIGIKQEKLETIFEPFSQADQSLSRKFGGTGLGTTISKHLVLLMGGEISAKSPSGLSPDPEYPGAEISFTLPLKTRKYLKSLDFKGIYSYAQLKCLVISDDPLQVQIISRNFIALGLDFKVLPPTKETLDLLIKRDPIHMVVIDHRYDFNGIEFLQEMHNHQLHQDHLIILQSSDYQSSNTTIAHRLGADVYLRKPIQLSTLREVILSNFPDLLAHEKDAILSVPEELKIMVIEDNLLNQKVIRNLIRKIGYDITIVVSVQEAFEVLHDCGFDLILADFYILQSANSAVVADMKSRNFKCPVVVMASSFDLNDDTRNALLHSGVDDFLLKPFDMQLVSEVLFRMVAP